MNEADGTNETHAKRKKKTRDVERETRDERQERKMDGRPKKMTLET